MKKVRIGVIGASWFADSWYLPVLHIHPKVELAAICSQNGVSAKSMAEKYNVKQVYTDYKLMMDQGNLDGVCIITPNFLHKEIALYAISKGLHMICEKPLAMNVFEAYEMFKEAKKQKIVHAMNFTYREHPLIQKVQKLLQEDFVGRVHEARFEYLGDYGLKGPPGWRGEAQKGGIGGVLQDLGSHLIDLAHYILDQQITKVNGSMKFYEKGILKDISHRELNNQAADSCSFFAEFSGGVQATFFTSWVSPQGNKHQTIEIHIEGSKGSLHLLTCELGSFLRYAQVGQDWKEMNIDQVCSFDLQAQPSEERFRPWRVTEKNEVWKWIDHITGNGSKSLATFEDGVYVQRVIDAVIESAIYSKHDTKEREE